MKKFLSTNLFFFIILCLSIFFIYGKSINFGLSNWDDDILTIKNIDYISSLKNIPGTFFKSCFFNNSSSYYRPILNISFFIETILVGYNTKIYHLTNILLFILSLYLIFVFLLKLKFNNLILKFCILLFAIHPIFSSVPVWIPARNDSLMTIFFTLSLINFFDYLKMGKNKNLILHMLFFFLALFSKETTVILVLIYPLFVYCFNLKINKKQVSFNLIFYIIIFLLYFTLRYVSVRSVNFLPLQVYLKNIFNGIMLYVDKFVYPSYMPIMLYDINKLTLQIYTINISVLFSLTIIYYKQIIDKKILLFAVIFSFLAILPTFAQEEYVFLTHRLIVSLTGIIIIITSLFEKIVTKYSSWIKYFFVIYIFLFLLFSFCSYKQIDKYKDSFTLWSNAYNDAPTYYVACNGLAKENVYVGNYKVAEELFYESKKNKNLYDADMDICTTLILQGRFNEAKEKLLKLVEYKEKACSLIYLSEIYYIEGDIEKSKEFAKRAYKIDKNDTLLLKHIRKLPNFEYEKE